MYLHKIRTIMKNTFIISMLLLILNCNITFAQTFVEEITESTTWTKANSPYVLQEGDGAQVSLLVHNNNSPITLTIEAGVQIIGKAYTAYTGDMANPEATQIVIGKNATLIVNGTSSEPVIFTSDQEDKEHSQWGSVILDEECNASACRISHALFEAGSWTGAYDEHLGALDIRKGSPLIRNCTFSKNYKGIYVEDGATPTIQNCNFTDTEKEAIILKGAGCKIQDNNFENNGCAIDMYTNTPAILQNNTFDFAETICFPDIINQNSTLGIPGTFPDGSNACYRLDDPSEHQLISCEITGAKLTIESGVGIKGNNRIVSWPATRHSTIEVQEGGAIKAEGSANGMVVFTGITNDDNEIVGWGGINFIENVNVGSSSFNYCQFNNTNTSVFIEEGCSGTLKVDNCTFREVEFFAEVETGATLDFSNSNFAQAYKGFRSIGGSLKFTNCQIDSTHWGAIYFEHGPSLIMDNTIISECSSGVDIAETNTEQTSPKVTIINTTIHNCSDGIWIGETPLDFTLSNSKITNSSDDGIEIHLHKDAKITIDNSIFDGGSSGLYFPSTDNEEKSPKVNITNSTIQNCNDGIHINETLLDLTFTNGKIINNSDDGIEVKLLKDASINISNSIIEGNGDNGIEHYHSRESVVMARGNWWGDASGPYDNSENDEDPTKLYNPDGLGDEVTDWVDYGDWLTFIEKEEPIIMCTNDVPNDQGRFIHLCWSASLLDVPGSHEPIVGYSIWRKVAASEICKSQNIHDIPVIISEQLLTKNNSDKWDYIDVVTPIPEFETYYYVAPTLGDSSPVGIYYSTFMIIAHTSNISTYYKSAPDSGYSIDNIAPLAPQNLQTKNMNGNNVELSWTLNTEPDFKHYVIYRATSIDFVLNNESFYQYTVDTTFTDQLAPGINYYYKISACDWNGNESITANSTGIVVGIVEFNEKQTTFIQNYSNPFSSYLTISINQMTKGAVEIQLLNINGQCVKTNSFKGVIGDNKITIDTNDLVAGTYFCSLKTNDFSQIVKCIKH